MKEESEALKLESVDTLRAQQNSSLHEHVRELEVKLEETASEKERLVEDLERQRTLYSELKKMRGRGEELEYIQACQQVREMLITIVRYIRLIPFLDYLHRTGAFTLPPAGRRS